MTRRTRRFDNLGRGIMVATLALMAQGTAAWQQQPPPLAAADFAVMRARGVPADTATRSEEWVVRLTDPPSSAGQARPAPTVALRGRSVLAIPLVRERDPQLSADRLLVIADGEDGSIADWRIVLDPRVIRSEQPDSTGLLSGTVLQQTSVDLRVVIGAVQGVRALRIYKPRWNGTDFDLEPVAVVEGGR